MSCNAALGLRVQYGIVPVEEDGSAHFFVEADKKLTKYLKRDHYEVDLSPEERIRVTTWIDSNGQYYGSYYGRKNLQYAGHPDFRPELTFEESHAITPPHR